MLPSRSRARLAQVEPSALLSVAEDDACALVVAAKTDWGRPVPQCSAWDAAGVVRHTGGIFLWMATIVTSGERVSQRALDPAPEDPAGLAAWYLGALEAADPDALTWTFSSIGDRRAAWWCRRLAVEVAIHRWDSQNAMADGGRRPDPLDGEVAEPGSRSSSSSSSPVSWPRRGSRASAGPSLSTPTDRRSGGSTSTPRARLSPGERTPIPPFGAPGRTSCSG
jgi:uncharacterized protein (TIGR03083 family)